MDEKLKAYFRNLIISGGRGEVQLSCGAVIIASEDESRSEMRG